MIESLNGSGHRKETADFTIIGGGTVGLFLSVWLAEAGYEVICLESGGYHQDSEEHALNEVVHIRSVYDGATHGRFRCIGGTSTRWGGALIPFQEEDLVQADWPIKMGELAAFIPKIENEFELASGSYDLADLSSTSHTARLAKWPPFKMRNVFNVLKGRIAALPNLTIWLDATVTDFTVGNGVLRTVRATSSTGDSITVEARRTIISAGAIESTRLLLAMDEQNSSVVSQASPDLGRNFSDHLSVVVGEIKTSRATELNRHVGFRFEANGTMRNLRFELSRDAGVRSSIPAGFGHIGLETGGEGGFDVLRNIFRSLQRRRFPAARDLLGLVRTSPWLCRAVWMRFVERRLLFPADARLLVHMVIDQVPRPDNRITLSKSGLDKLGMPLAEISWTVSEEDQNNLTRSVDAFESMWNALPLSSSNDFVRRSPGAAEAELATGGGIYHPTGSTRMGRSADDGVVDRDLRLFTVSNVQIVATSVLPTGGGANPTMMLLLLAARCVEQIGKKNS